MYNSRAHIVHPSSRMQRSTKKEMLLLRSPRWLVIGPLMCCLGIILLAPVLSLSSDANTSTPALVLDDDDDHSVEALPVLASPILLSTAAAAAAAAAPNNCQEWNADNRLECWLWQLRVEIPAESFSADWITISIKDMVCTHFALHNLQSDYLAPHSVELSVHTLQATCQGKYHASGGISGNVEAGVSTQKKAEALQVAFRVVPSTAYPLIRPYTFQTTNCQTHLQATNIHFSGSMSAKLIQAFSKTIGHYISQALQEQTCPLLPKELDPLVTDYLHQLDDWMKPYLMPKNSNMMVGSSSSSSSSSMDYYFSNYRKNATKLSPSIRVPTNNNGRERRLGSTMPRVQWDNVSTSVLVTSNNNKNTDDTAAVVDPIDWDVVFWALSLFNTELAEHLQQGWLFNSNNTQKYCPQHKCQNMFRGLSGWFRSIVGPQLLIPLPPYFHNISLPPLPLDANVSVGADHISIQGLDLLSILQVFRPMTLPKGNSTSSTNALASQLSTTSEISIEAPIALNIQMAANSNKHALLEPFTVKINVTKLETLLTTTLKVMDWDQTSLLQVVDAVQRFVEHPTPENIRPVLGCLIRTIVNLENVDWITSLVLDSVTVTRRTARFQNQTDSLEDDLDHVINSVLELLLGEYSDLWTDLIQGLIRDPARHSLNDYLRNWLRHHSSAHVCPPAVVPTTATPKWLNFSKFLILDHFNDFLNHESTLHTVNQYLECVGNYFEGYVAARASGNDHHANSRRMDVAAANQPRLQGLLEVVQVEAKHWNAVQHIQLMQPTDDTTLESSIQWGSNTTVPQLHVTLQVDTEQLSGIVNITLFAGLQAKLGTMLNYNLNRLENLTVAHLLQQVQCGMVPTIDVRLLPHVTAADLGPRVGLNVSAILNNQSVSYSTNDSTSTGNNNTDNVANLAAGALEWSVEWARNLANKALKGLVVRSPDICPGIVPNEKVPDDHGHDNDDSAWYDYPMIWIVVVFVVLGQGGLVGIVKGPDEREESNGENPEPNPLTTPLLAAPLEDDIMDPAPLEHDVDDYARAMMEMDQALLNDIRDTSADGDPPSMIVDEETFVSDEELEDLKPLLIASAIPEIVRFAIPMLIIVTIILLFSSNVSVGASVNMSIRVGGTPIHLPGLFEFSLGNTISELFGARIYPLLFLVVVFSGIWPYAKLVLMFYIWNASYRDTLQREQRLLTLDALSKFSLVDTYVLVVMLVAFRFHLDLSEELGLDVYVTPEYGFYAFLLATCMSLVLGHGMLYFHRKAEHPGHRETIEHLIERKSVFDHAFDVEDNGPRRPLSHIFQVIVFTSCLFAILFLILGFGQESFAFEFGGLAGMALSEKNSTSYSLLSLGAAIPRSVEDSNSLGILFLQIAYYFYAVLTPVACLTLLMVLLLYPATPKMQKRLLVAAEIANAWSAVEVFVLSIVAALFQISTFASFIIGDKCDLVNKIAVRLIGGEIIPANDAVCFRVVASVEPSCWYLVVGVLMNSFVSSLVLRLAHAAVHERSGHGGGNTFPRQLFGSPIGVVFFGPEVGEDNGLQEGGAEGEEEADGEEENAPDWRFWF